MRIEIRSRILATIGASAIVTECVTSGRQREGDLRGPVPPRHRGADSVRGVFLCRLTQINSARLPR